MVSITAWGDNLFYGQHLFQMLRGGKGRGVVIVNLQYKLHAPLVHRQAVTRVYALAQMAGAPPGGNEYAYQGAGAAREKQIHAHGVPNQL